MSDRDLSDIYDEPQVILPPIEGENLNVLEIELLELVQPRFWDRRLGDD